jgi:hypothetical protein
LVQLDADFEFGLAVLRSINSCHITTVNLLKFNIVIEKYIFFLLKRR